MAARIRTDDFEARVIHVRRENDGPQRAGQTPAFPGSYEQVSEWILFAVQAVFAANLLHLSADCMLIIRSNRMAHQSTRQPAELPRIHRRNNSAAESAKRRPARVS